MKVCYLLQSHKNPEQIYRLVRIIKKSSPDSEVLVSHDFTNCNLDDSVLQNLSGVHVIPGKGGRGDFSIVQGYLDAVDWLLSRQIKFDWLINISGQDYPIQPLSQIEKFLSQTSYDGFFEYFDVFSKQSHWSIREAHTRYLYRYQKLGVELTEWQRQILTPLKIINYIQPFFRINIAYELIGVRASAPFNENFSCYGGSYFCTLSRKCIEYIYDFSQSKPEIVDYYRSVCVSDESFIQTVLINSRLFNLCNDSKRYFDFSKTRNGRPQTLTTNDYPALVESNAHFARKFDIAQDSKILDLLDTIILQSPQEYHQEANTL
ncbi:beta-1,6-N-acetylglucosaminyltransferase [Allocoleopsis sp.]|uniref:beta-1,6-N-acetylglucosaminyltransferase n=1 Tax=Allocoleopsis sp. TaxID=3088169 RepID=UPI002FD67D9F